MLIGTNFPLLIPFLLSFFFFIIIWFCLVSPEFAYRPGLGVVAEGASSSNSGATGSGGAPNRPLPPTPDDDDSQGDKTLVLRRVSQIYVTVLSYISNSKKHCCYYSNCIVASRR